MFNLQCLCLLISHWIAKCSSTINNIYILFYIAKVIVIFIVISVVIDMLRGKKMILTLTAVKKPWILFFFFAHKKNETYTVRTIMFTLTSLFLTQCKRKMKKPCNTTGRNGFFTWKRAEIVTLSNLKAYHILLEWCPVLLNSCIMCVLRVWDLRECFFFFLSWQLGSAPVPTLSFPRVSL